MEREDKVSDGYLSPELAPVELPDWVKEYLIAKRKAQEALKENEGQQDFCKSMQIMADFINEDQDIHKCEAVISDAPHETGLVLDSTGSIFYNMSYSL